jgi:hypothetical protein
MSMQLSMSSALSTMVWPMLSMLSPSLSVASGNGNDNHDMAIAMCMASFSNAPFDNA